MTILNGIIGNNCPHCELRSELLEIHPGVRIVRLVHSDDCPLKVEVCS